MNSLNLRVSTVKTGENVKKNSEIRAELVTLPKQYVDSEEYYCLELRQSKTIPEQVAAVKKTFKNLSADPRVLQFLTDLFFHCPLKHPVRNQILKLLITAARVGTGSIDESSIISALADALQQLVEETKIETESSKWNLSITSLMSCFENFLCGMRALEQRISLVFPFLCAAVQKYITELSVLSSPSVRNEYYLYVHSAVRLALSCVQEFSTKLKELHSEHLKQLNTLCKEIILDDEIPMDPRTNAGILMAHNAKIFDEYDVFIQSVKLTKNPLEIALCVGIVNTCDQHDFQRISADVRDICSKIDEIANANANVPNILLSAARALYQISKLMLSFELRTASIADDAKLILRKLLIFTFGYLEHHMDSVRHICRDLLRNIVAAARKIQFDFLLQKIYDACNSERLSLSMKCVVLQQAVVILGANEIITNCSELFSGLFAEHLGRDFMVNNLYEALMSASHKELDYTAWFKQWLEYLLEIAAANDPRLPDIENLIVKAVKCDPRIVQQITLEHDDNHPGIPISTKLSTLWAVRKCGIKMDNFNEIMQNFSKCLLYSILSNSDETRIMALRLLVESHKTTELLTALECEHLLTYLEYNSNCQSPATRQKSLCLLSKVMMRCELNLMKLLKDDQQVSGNDVASPPLQQKFLHGMLRILVSNLFSGANFSRRTISLQLLDQCIRICINCDLKLAEALPENTIIALTMTLSDSYEANKELAVTILKLIEDKMDSSLIEQHHLCINLLQMKDLLISVRPIDSVTAAYQLEFYCNRAAPQEFGDYDLPCYNETYYAALRWLLLELKVGVKVAKQSILRAARANPLYGIIFAIKHLMKHLDFQTLAQEIAWRILVAELIVLCKELTTLVGPVVNSDSPEGHLPNDFSELPDEDDAVSTDVDSDLSEALQKTAGASCKILSSKTKKIDLSGIKTTSQMVLLCAWRTVKEVSLILGEIVLRSPIQFSKLTEQFLITKEQILEIGEHFKQLLAETKHRGAFEQAYVGFSKLACRLWRVEVHDLTALPMQWLRELIALISRDEQINDKICSTRRSAGVPFMVQALITSELQVGSTKSLYFAMSHLLQLCSLGERSAESRTHALNILRALFRCTDLNEAVGEYAAEGLMCAIRSYGAATWPEKNSATLLFAALITRIFGVQRTRDSDNLNIRNRMTGRVFFLRYPRLYDFFLQELQLASELVLQQQKAHKLHPLLLILSRLYPSALEGTESNLKLSEFIPYISNCAGCPEMQTRYLAAKAVVALIAKDAVTVSILRKCSDIVFSADNPKEISLNMLHGQLLQILLLLKSQKSHDAELISDLSCTIVLLHEKTLLKNAVVLKVMLDIFIEIMNNLTSLNFAQTTVQNLLYFSIRKELHDAELSHNYAVLRKSFYIYNLHTLRLTLPYGAISDFLLNPPLTCADVQLETAETCLNIILLLLLRAAAVDVNNDAFAEFEFLPAELQFVHILDAAVLDDLASELRQSKNLYCMLKDIVKQPIYYPECTMKAYGILSLHAFFDFTLSHLIKESKQHPSDVKSALAMCVECLVLKQGGVDAKIAQSCLEYLLEIAQPWHPDSLRLKASQILAHIAVHYTKALEKKRLTFVRLYIGLVLALLMDDDYDIRDNTAKIVVNNLSDDIGMENVVSTMAQRLFLQSTADILLAMKAEDSYILDIFKIITEALNVSNTSDEESSNSSMNASPSDHRPTVGNAATTRSGSVDLDIFDKNEANVFAEPLKAISDTIVVFRNTFSERAKVLSFVKEYKVW